MHPDFVMNEEITRLTKEVSDAKNRLRDALRRAAPEPVRDWELHRPDGTPVRLSELFAGRRDLILWHNMGRSCVYCTLWADGLRGYAEHLQDRAAFALVSADEPKVLNEFSTSRGWNFPCVSGGPEFRKALKMCDAKTGNPWPGISALAMKPDGSIVRTGYTNFGPGDDFCPVWPAFDLLDQGPKDWSPKYSYSVKPAHSCCGGGCRS